MDPKTHSSAAPSSSARGGSQDRSWRGRGRGRGRGREGFGGGPPTRDGGHHGLSNTASAAVVPRAPRHPAPRPRLTHFLALPLGHHAGLRQKLTSFTTALLHSNPAIPGLDESIVVSARRMHLTLGVMSLTERDSGHSGETSSSPPRTLHSAAALLQKVKPGIMALLSGHKLQVALKRVDIMKPERGSLDKAHVFWAGPPEDGDDVARLKAVSHFIHDEFVKAGLVVDEKRPLKLHCTVLNTTYRKPRGDRLPFSYSALLATPAFKTIERMPSVLPPDDPRARGKAPISVDLGEWTVDEVQICEMGSYGPQGEYVAAARCRLD
ncbi:AKAP7 2'5' RNA ligase-like domain-containing protein [Cristinia sonorae]|uniref:AKAP7 2'5' RNA ligase-like domain-containing protein n=1 Tax=Cristinia sonorae TaxID=1940300 RepID=A0A8K0UDH1_9AGAR|nr:AKAP7 2'5' RNA ligase-like domain-containing protein [Cristinia sonorae]